MSTAEASIFPDIRHAGMAGMFERFRQRKDSEHENILISLVIGSLIVAYLLIHFGLDRVTGETALGPLIVALTGLSVAVGLLLHMLWQPGISHGRRIVAMFMHLGSLSAFMNLGGELTAPFYPIYLWVTLGNGFRYGVRYLMAAATLSVLGFGTGNWQDAKMEQLSNHGNGTFAYIDTQREARKVLIEQAAGTLVTIAKDVKFQVEFNPRKVGAYRLIGYSNRLLEAQDFNDDTKDAGEIGAGHTVTALYEVVPAGVEVEMPDIDKLKYQQTDGEGEEAGVDASANEDAASDDADASSMEDELLTVKLRYKRPEGDTSTKIEFPLVDDGGTIDAADVDVRFAAAVAQFGMLLRDSPYKGDASWAQVLDLAESGRGEDSHGYRAEFIELVRKAQGIAEAQRN